MAVWSSNNIMLTQKGQELLSKVQAGVGQLTITKVVTGSGRVSASSLFTQTAVSSIKQNMSVTKVTTMSTGSNLELQVTNTNLSSSYNINQIGVYASHPDMGEILYMIAQCDEGTADIMPLPSVTPVTMNYMFYLIHSALTQLNITVDPAGLVSVATFNEHLEDFQELCDFVGYNDEQVYGVEIDYENRKYTRLGANIGLSQGADFDSLAPWGGRRRCNLTDEGVVVAYYGDAGYSETGVLTDSVVKDGVTYPAGTKVQVMVEQPKFWYKTVPVKMEKQNNQSGWSLVKARYYVSLTPRTGFKLYPLFQRGIPLVDADVAYLPAFRGSIFDVSPAVVEKNTLTVTQGATTAGSITITLDKYGESKKIALEASDSTPEAVAARIRATTFDSWLISGTGADVIFTCKNAGARNTVEFKDTDNTGASCNIAKTQTGAGGYVENDAQVASFTEGTGDLLCSIAGVKPASGLSQNLTRRNVTVLANNRNIDPETSKSRFKAGFGWQQKDLSANMCTAYLFLIEYGSLDAYTKVGRGVSSLTDDGVTNMAYRNGDTSALGNATGEADGIIGKRSVTYRGEENNWCNGSYWEEGLNIEAKGKNDAYFSHTGIYTDNSKEADGYKSTGFSLAKANGYVNRVGYSEDFDWGFLATKTTGSSNYPIHDYFYQNYTYNGWYVSYRYCAWTNGALVGLCSRAVNITSSIRSRAFGGCLLFVPEPKGTPVTGV